MRIQYLWSIILVVHLASLLCRLLLVLVFVVLVVRHFSSTSFFAAYEDSVCVFHCSCWKSIDLINLENVFGVVCVWWCVCVCGVVCV